MSVPKHLINFLNDTLSHLLQDRGNDVNFPRSEMAGLK